MSIKCEYETRKKAIELNQGDGISVYRDYGKTVYHDPGNSAYHFHLVGPRHLRGPEGVTRFYSIHTIDIAGLTAAASQFRDKRTISLGRHLVDSWRVMGLPRVSQMDNEMAATGGGRYRYSLSQLIRLHLLLGIHLLFIPQGEPGRNAAAESFNGFWQKRVLIHTCPIFGLCAGRTSASSATTTSRSPIEASPWPITGFGSPAFFAIGSG